MIGHHNCMYLGRARPVHHQLKVQMPGCETWSGGLQALVASKIDYIAYAGSHEIKFEA
jgi:hypothetical protein